MGKDTKIAWCDNSFNPWFGCSQILGRRACQTCYAKAFTKRLGLDVFGVSKTRKMFGDPRTGSSAELTAPLGSESADRSRWTGFATFGTSARPSRSRSCTSRAQSTANSSSFPS